MKPTSERIQKLPKWAQDHIIQLKREGTDAARKLKDYLDGQTKSNVTIEDRVAGQTCYLQTDEVTFCLPKDEITIRIKNDVLHCMAAYGRIVIVPHVTNVVDLRVERL